MGGGLDRSIDCSGPSGRLKASGFLFFYKNLHISLTDISWFDPEPIHSGSNSQLDMGARIFFEFILGFFGGKRCFRRQESPDLPVHSFGGGHRVRLG